MNINEYIKILTKLAQNNPDAILIYASDDEGNSYERVRHIPCVCQFNIYEREAYFPEATKDPPRSTGSWRLAICIN